MNIDDVNPNELIEKAAKKLQEESLIEAPQWSQFVKTGVSRERPPARDDWWYVRGASILRKVYKLGPIGTNKLRMKYGGKKNRGHKPDAFRKGSGNLIRKLLQGLESSGLIEKSKIKKRKGRVITPKGRSFLDKLAVEMSK